MVLALPACDNGLQPVDDPAGTDAPWQEDVAAEDLWALAPAEARCEAYTDPDGVVWPIPGATSYFAGDYQVGEDGNVRGKERWLLASNQAWRDEGEGDCMVTWAVTGTVGDPSCNSCDYSMSVQAQVIDGETDCPRGLIVGEETWAVDYDVSLLPDGRAQFRYLDSGNLLGEGYWEGARVTYLTESRCMWF